MKTIAEVAEVYGVLEMQTVYNAQADDKWTCTVMAYEAGESTPSGNVVAQGKGSGVTQETAEGNAIEALMKNGGAA